MGNRSEKMFQNGDSYDGEWQNFLMHGKGVYHYSDGRFQDGYFQKGKTCVPGIIKNSSGDSYDGEWKDDQKHGGGVYRQSDGAVYAGNFENRVGQGFLKYKSSSVEFDKYGQRYGGRWENDISKRWISWDYFPLCYQNPNLSESAKEDSKKYQTSVESTQKASIEIAIQNTIYWQGKYLQSNGFGYTSLPKFSLKFGGLNQLNLIPVNGSGDNIEGRYEITGQYDPQQSYLRLKQAYERHERDIKLTWNTDRNQFEGLYASSKDSGSFCIKPVKQRVHDINLKVEDILKDPVIIYSRQATQTTLMKGNFDGDKAVAKIFVTNRKEQAQSILDTEAQFQMDFQDEEDVVQVYDYYLLHTGLKYSAVLVMESIENGSCQDQIEMRSPMKKQYLNNEIFTILYRSLHILTCAAHFKIYHWDLKPANILLKPDGLPKIADFGESIRNSGKGNSVIKGTPAFFSYILRSAYNEMRSTRQTPDFIHNPEKSDVMSLAITIISMWLLRVVTGINNPYNYLEPQQLVWKEMVACGYSEDLISILRWMLTFFETERPSFRQVLDKVSELSNKTKWARMNEISLVKAPKEGSKTDIDMQYLQETISVFCHNDPKQYWTLPSKISPVDASKASWIPEKASDLNLDGETIVEDNIQSHHWPFQVPKRAQDNEVDPENYRQETTSYVPPIAAVAKSPLEEEKYK